MDLRLMIKEMIKQGMGDDEIVANLKAVGVEDVEKAIADALAAEEKAKPEASKAEAQGKAQTPIGTVQDEKEEAEELEIEGLGASKSLFEEAEKPAQEAKPLFEKGGGEEEIVKPLFEETRKPSVEEKEGADEATEEIPRLEITKVEGAEEKKTDIASMLKKAGVESVMQPMPQTSFQDIDALERKIDDLLAAVKAMQEINRQILEANREMLFKLKTQK